MRTGPVPVRAPVARVAARRRPDSMPLLFPPRETDMSSLLITGATLLPFDTPDQPPVTGDIRIVDGTITAVGCVPARADVDEVVSAHGMIAMPGIVDTHRHTWQALIRHSATDATFGEYFAHVLMNLSAKLTPEDMHLGNLLGALDALNAGVTTVLDWCHATNTREHAFAAAQGLRDAGVRAVWAYGPPSIDWWNPDGAPTARDVRAGVDRVRAWPMMGAALAIRGPEFSTAERVADDIRLARALGIPVTMHAGIPGFHDKVPSVRMLSDTGLLGPDLTFVHCAAFGDEDWKLVADSGAKASLSLRTDLQMGFGEPRLAAALRAGVHPAVSTDSATASGPSDLRADLRLLLRAHRATAHAAAAADGVPLDHLPGPTIAQALRAVTTDAAATLGLTGLGRLSPGSPGDVILIDPTVPGLLGSVDPYAVALDAQPDAVRTVIVGGRVRKRDGHLVGVDLYWLRTRVARAHQRLLAG